MSSDTLSTVQPVDYLVIGHITIDITPAGILIGGTAGYAALNALQHGFRVGIYTSYGNELPLDVFRDVQIVNIGADKSSTFENVYTEAGRIQTIRSVGKKLDVSQIPEIWKRARIIHLAPVANEILPFDPSILRSEVLGATPQGWLRTWDEAGVISSGKWNPDIERILQSSVVVLSSEDLMHDEEEFEHYAHNCRILAITEGKNGSRLYWNGDVRRFATRSVQEVDPTGAGDIFASSFFIRLLTTRDPWEASRYANQAASFSVTRKGMSSVPTPEELKLALVEVLN